VTDTPLLHSATITLMSKGYQGNALKNLNYHHVIHIEPSGL